MLIIKSKMIILIQNKYSKDYKEYEAPIKEEELKNINLTGFDDKNTVIGMVKGNIGAELKNLIQSYIEQEKGKPNMKTLNKIGEIISNSKTNKIILINALIEIGKIKNIENLIYFNASKKIDKFKIFYYDVRTNSERIENYLSDSKKNKEDIIVKRNNEYVRIRDNYGNKLEKYFTSYGYLVKDFQKLKRQEKLKSEENEIE